MTDLPKPTSVGTQARLKELIQYCYKCPRTIEDISKHFDWHSQTSRKYVWELQSQGRIIEVASRIGRRKMWQASDKWKESGEVAVPTIIGLLSLKRITESYGPPDTTPTINMIAGCLSYLWRRAYYRTQNQDNIKNVVKQGNLDPYLQVRPAMEDISRRITALLEVLNFILTDISEIWSDDPSIVKMLGVVSQEEQLRIEEAASWFEPWITERIERMKNEN